MNNATMNYEITVTCTPTDYPNDGIKKGILDANSQGPFTSRYVAQ
jgi:hypothetical protein